MNTITKSAIAIAVTGTTVTGGYFGGKALSSSRSLSQEEWEKQNKVGFNSKGKAFIKKVQEDSSSAKVLGNEWQELQKELAGNVSMSEYQRARKLQEGCSKSNSDNKFSKVRAECSTTL